MDLVAIYYSSFPFESVTQLSFKPPIRIENSLNTVSQILPTFVFFRTINKFIFMPIHGTELSSGALCGVARVC